MNRELARAVVAVFRTESAEAMEQDLVRFGEHEWMHTRRWLHTSGLALYFFDRVTNFGVAGVVPEELIREISVNLEENRIRTADLFEEFARINMDFQRAGILYANLKGFTLVPTTCTDPALRYQHDLDLLVSRRDAERCRQVLARHGYRQTATFDDTWEFRAGAAEVCTMRELYRVRAQRSLEVHLLPEDEEERTSNRLSRLQLQSWRGLEFPSLGKCDKLLAQAMHLFKHFQTEWTRTAWLLEYAAAIRAHAGDELLWREVTATLSTAAAMRTGVGMASLIAGRTFGVKLPAQLACPAQTIPPQVRLWVDRYESEVVFTEHPGSKLYLLLKDVLLQDSAEWRRQRRERLLPHRLPPRIVVARSDSTRMRWRTQMEQMRFVLLRLRFHIVSGLRYRLEAARWRRLVASAQ